MKLQDSQQTNPYSLASYDTKTLEKARDTVANDWRELGHAIRTEDSYGPQITEKEKDQFLAKHLSYAEEIRIGKHDHNFTILQRLILELSGECVAFLP